MWHSVPLTLFWFAYFGSLGIFFPYFSLYLRENAGLTGTQSGIVLAITPLVGMVAQPFWGQVADRTGARGRILAFLTAATGLGYLAMWLAEGFRAIALATAAMALVGTALFPILISVSLAILRDAGSHAFGYVRVWGTLGFFALVIVFPSLLRQFEIPPTIAEKISSVAQPGLGLMFPIIAALAFIAAIIGLFLPNRGFVALRADRGDWRELLHNRSFRRFLLFSLLANFLMHGPMWFFPLFVRSRGGDLEMIRGMWMLMLTVEIPLVLSTGRGLERFGARGLLAVGLLVGGLRWGLCALITEPTLLFAIQALHGVTVVGLNLGSPLYLDVVAPEKLRSTAQGILSMVSMGIAAMMSNISAGWLVEKGGTDALYLISGLGCLALGLLTWFILPAAAPRSTALSEAMLSNESFG
jgi:PPP family 3-phenylpropionic acid transporter